MDLFHTWISSSMLTNLRLSTENRHTLTSMYAAIPVPLHPPIIQRHQIPYKMSSHPMLPIYKRNWTQSTLPPYKMVTPDRVKRMMDSVKQKLENSNKLTLKQFNIQLKLKTPPLITSFLFQLTVTKKVTSLSRTT